LQEWNDQQAKEEGYPKRFGVRIPLGPLPASYKVVHITETHHSVPFPTALGSNPYQPGVAFVLPEPSVTLFCDPATPRSLAAFHEANEALISIRLSTYSDCVSVGVTAPHGVFDGKGICLVLKAIQAELHGEEWVAPPLFTENQCVKGVEELLDATRHDPAASIAAGLAKGGMLSHVRSITHIFDLAKFLFTKLFIDPLLHSGTRKSAFVARELLEPLVAQAKAEVAAQGKGEYVSTQDVVTAWFLRAALAGEKKKRKTLAFSGTFCFRSVVDKHTSADLSAYPHSCVWAFPMTPSPSFAQVASAPLSSLALTHRRSLLRARSPAALAGLFRYMKRYHWRILVPRAGWGVEPFFLTNQVEAAMPSAVDWSAIVPGVPKGGGRGCFWEWSTPQGMDHFMVLNEVQNGWLWSGGMRKTRWASLEKALAELEEDAADDSKLDEEKY